MCTFAIRKVPPCVETNQKKKKKKNNNIINIFIFYKHYGLRNW